MSTSEQPLPAPAAGAIAVGSLSQANRHKRRFDAVLTLEDPRARPGQKLRFTTKPAPAHLVLAFEDVDSEEHGFLTADADQVATALAFGRTHADGSLLVHCFHGVGRSAACALAILADRAGPGGEAQAVADLFAMRPPATPNRIVVAHADVLLGRNGALVAALDAHEAADPRMAHKREARRRLATDRPELFARKP